MRSRVMKIETFFQLVWTFAELSMLWLMLNFMFIPRALDGTIYLLARFSFDRGMVILFCLDHFWLSLKVDLL